MLRRAENVRIYHKASFFTGKGMLTLFLGPTQYQIARIHRDEFASMTREQVESPVSVASVKDRTYWWFQDRFYWENDSLTEDDVYALLVTRQQRQRQHLDRAKATVALDSEARQARRGVIADDLRQFVWERDKGTCQKCGSTSELQFDHIIPVALGGGTAAENLQVLCGPCNRRKGAGLA